MKNTPYWLDTAPLYRGEKSDVPDGEIAVIGSGLAGSSVAYFLKQAGMKATIIDFEPEKSASYRNAGHILFGAGESYKAMCSIHGREKAKRIMELSYFCTQQIYDTIHINGIRCDYRNTDSFNFPIDETEFKELKESCHMLHQDGLGGYKFMTGSSEYGIPWDYPVQRCIRSATANPVKFRAFMIGLSRAPLYEKEVASVNDAGDGVVISFKDGKEARFDAAVLATNAYSSLVSDYFESRGTIEPFRGQIIVSEPIRDQMEKHDFFIEGAHSSDHGYIYATALPDDRLLIGGWRNNIEGSEVGSYELKTNPDITKGLKEWVKNRYPFDEKINWEYEWTGIMGSSNSGLPYVGPTNSPLIFTCAGFTGYGFGWAHGCAKILVDIMAGNELVDGWDLLRP